MTDDQPVEPPAPLDAASVSLDEQAARISARDRDLVEVAIVGVQQHDEVAQGATVTLRDPESGGEVQVVMAGVDAAALSDAMGGVTPPRPRTHDLLADLANAIGADAVRAAIVHRRDNGVFEAEVAIKGPDGTEHRLDCRPSDALNLALRAASCPLMVAPHLLTGPAPAASD